MNKFRNKRKRDTSEEVCNKRRHVLPNYLPKEDGTDTSPLVEKMRQGKLHGREVLGLYYVLFNLI